MAIITTNTSRLPVVDKCQRGATIITLSTDNPNVPGNAEALAAFSAIQDELVAANAAVIAAQSTLRALLAQRDAVEKRWDRGISQFAGITEALADSDPQAIVSTGFGVRVTTGRPQPLPAPTGLAAATNGSPGKTRLSWSVLDGALIYFVEMSLDEGVPANWRRVTMSTRATCELDGAQPGKPAWFRVAAVNATGQSPWSVPAQRPVM